MQKYKKVLFWPVLGTPLEMAGFSHFLRTAQNWPFLGIFYVLILFLIKFL
jgi:hypothetical protein